VPVVVLVNHETAGAAEALAALLRETGAGLILGGRTAGRAMVTRDFPLSSGGRLRIAIAPVTLGGGGALPAEGVKPDIGVAVSPEDERAYYENAFVVLPKTNTLAGARPPSANPPGGTNQISRRVRLNEAELVREHQEGMDRDPDTDSPPRAPEPVKPLVTDPALARALDLVKGLALVRRRHQ
jgi:carboxyl-terminal processing protease